MPCPIEHRRFALPAFEQFGAEQCCAPPPTIFRIIKGDVGVFDQGGDVIAMVGEERDADADPTFDRTTPISERGVQMLGNALEDRLQ